MKNWFYRLTLVWAWLCCATPAWPQVGMQTLPTAQGPLTLVYPTTVRSQALALGPFVLEVALNAPPKPPAKPLVLLSHGSGGSAATDFTLAKAFAQAGFVVAQVQHEGDNYADKRLSGPASFAKRPGEVTAAINTLLAHPTWAAHIDPSRIGVHGMSAGGLTALALAGGQWNVLQLIRHCGQHLNEDIAFCLHGAQSAEQRAQRERQFTSAQGVPDARCQVPCDHVPRRSWALFKARAVLTALFSGIDLENNA